MLLAISTPLIELAALLLFGLAYRSAVRRGGAAAQELATAAGYGLLLEILDLALFRTYHYSGAFRLQIGGAPLAIALLWGVILQSAMALSDRLALPAPVRPLLDGLLAVLLDLSLDAVAIRVGYWHWTIPLTAGWYGVPAGNLSAWIWVAVWFSAATRAVRASPGLRRWHGQWAAPLVAYAGLYVSILAVGLVQGYVGAVTPRARLGVFWWQVGLFLSIVAAASRHRGASGPRVPRVLGVGRWSVHLFFFLLLWISGSWRSVPSLVVVSLGTGAMEFWVQRTAAR